MLTLAALLLLAQTPTDPALPGIVFVGAPIFDEKTDGGEGVYQGSYHWRDGYIYPRAATFHRGERTMGPPRPGRNLYSLIPARPDGKLTRLTHLKTGAVYRPEPSYDGKRILFSLRRDGEDWFHLCEMNVDGTGLKQLTDGPFNDFAGVYLPDGRIGFCSDRTGYLEEYHEERTEALFTMHADGTHVEQITCLPGTYFEPSVMKDGRVLFAYWDPFHIDVPPFDKHETYLVTVNPDGTEERHLFGAGQYRFFNRERHSGVGIGQAREMPDGRILCQTEMGPCLIDLRAGLPIRDALAPIFPGTTSVQLGGTTNRVHLSPLGTRSTPYPLENGRFLFSKTEPGARDSGIYVCDPDTRQETLVLRIPDYAEFDAVPVLVEREKPARLPDRQKGETSAKLEAGMTRFLVVAGRVSDNPKRAEALKRARYYRVVEAEYTGVTTSSHTNLETRILGMVPILPDGSAYFEAPADTPIFLDPIDAGGNRVLMEWNYPNTSVATRLPYPATQMAYMSGRAGETKSCYGCHAPQTEAVPNVKPMALQYGPVKITRKSTDIEYRRNDPEAYRTQARVGEAAKLRPLLKSNNAALRAMACEMLMYVEDMDYWKSRKVCIAGLMFWAPRRSWEDTEAIAELLKDESLEVRRAAAKALTRLGTKEEASVLKETLKDNDWQVRFAAVCALEAIGEVDALKSHPLAADTPRPPFEALGRVRHWQHLPPESQERLLDELAKAVPHVLAIRAAGRLEHDKLVELLVPWLQKHEYEYHAAEAALALGRLGTDESERALRRALRSEVPIKTVHVARYFQHGPRPEEYALLKGLVLAKLVGPLSRLARTDLEDVHLLLALLPATFQEKPRFEDRLRGESQRVLMPRLLLDRGRDRDGPTYRERIVAILVAALRGKQENSDPLHSQVLKGLNLERPFSEHGRPFNVVKEIGAEESLWLLACLVEPEKDFPKLVKRDDLESLVSPLLTSKNPRERIDAAVLLGLIGFGPHAADILATQIAKPYPFGEIASMGKGMPDDNFRDKAYFAQALARHIDDVNKLKPFADPKKNTRDVRYGLTHGLAFRAKADGIPLLAEVATSDPITLIRQQARYAIADIQDAYRLAGKPVPDVKMPPEQPLEALYPPRGLAWSDTQFNEFSRECEQPPTDVSTLAKYVQNCLAPGNFRNLNNAHAAGAERMMIRHVEETRLAFEALAKLPGESGRRLLLAALDTPYPYIHYLALTAFIERRDAGVAPILAKKLDAFLAAQDTVGFWWCCEALAQLKAKEALPILAKHAKPTNPPGAFGPEGMAVGFVAAKAVAQIAADPKRREVAHLLASENVWLRAGALRGLAEAKAPGVEALLRAAADEVSPAVVRTEARVQLRRSNEKP